MSAADVESWQTSPTIKERSKFIFNNDLFSDVKFVIGKTDGELSESKRRKQVIPAHKLVLSISSPVFEAMFYGELAETGDSIELPDCEYESLLELFRYIYSDEVNLSGGNVMGVLYLAKKYIVPSLADKCIEYLQDNVDPSNVFSILPFAQKEAVKSEGFVKIERSLLEAVVARDSLTLEEIELFKAVDLWAKEECERQGLAADGAIKRRVLGEGIVKALRLPTIKQEDFASVVLDSKILTPDEIVSVIKCLSSVSQSPVGFPEKKRPGFKGNLQRCCTFQLLRSCCTSRSSIGPIEVCHILNFSVDRDITLHGVRLFGCANASYTMDLTIENTKRNFVLGSESGQFFAEPLQCKVRDYNGFEVLFNRGIVLVKNTTFCLKAKITGRQIWYHSRLSSVTCSGITFTIQDSEREEDEGQFPELLFSPY
ncbi:hypothetical protein ACROYT_G008768 [Oculina patagonica]